MRTSEKGTARQVGSIEVSAQWEGKKRSAGIAPVLGIRTTRRLSA
jgi:hypothetical protein